MKPTYMIFALAALILWGLGAWRYILNAMRTVQERNFSGWSQTWGLVVDAGVFLATLAVVFQGLFYSGLAYVGYEGWKELVFGLFLVLFIVLLAWIFTFCASWLLSGVVQPGFERISKILFVIPVVFNLIMVGMYYV